MIIPYIDSLNFEIYVGDLIEALKPKSEEEIERIADELHQSLEIGISDFIDDSEEFDLDNYNPQY